ncbi:MAG: metal ABC transporter substrate-binding protein [Ilumatobacteraceae bacterium]
MRGRYRTTMTMIGAIGLVAASCGGDDEPTGAPAGDPGDDRPLIVATTSIWADVTANVVCHDLAEVSAVVPTGVDAHFYEPSLQDRGLMGDAAIVVANGLALEESLVGTLETVAAEGVPVFEVADHVADPLESTEDEHDEHDDDHDDDHDGDDPHVWLDPARVAAALPVLGDAIVDATGIDADAVAECVDEYQAELLDIDAEIADMFTAIDDDMRKLVSTHESLGYFADRYDFEIIGTVLEGTSSMAETNPAALEELANDVIATGVPAVFAEAETSQADMEALADRAGVEVVVLPTESLGEPDSGYGTYVDFLRHNAQLISDALA